MGVSQNSPYILLCRDGHYPVLTPIYLQVSLVFRRIPLFLEAPKNHTNSEARFGPSFSRVVHGVCGGGGGGVCRDV